MIFADKLIELRKRNGMTQEELAEKMDVSRQSIAKWEGAQSVPELNKIIKLSQLFDVSTDYLLKDEIELPDKGCTFDASEEKAIRRVTMEEANRFLESRRKAAIPMAVATMLCILSPVFLIFFGVLSETAYYPISENLASGIGLTALIVIVAVAVGIFVSIGSKNDKYKYLEKEAIDTEYGVDGMVKELRERFRSTYDRCNIFGTVACILSVLPIFINLMLAEDNDFLVGIAFCLLLAIVAIGVFLFVRVGVIWASFSKLLQVGEFSADKKKEHNSVVGVVSTAYWCIITAIYLVTSFSSGSWDKTWLIWAVSGILYPVLIGILRVIVKDK